MKKKPYFIKLYNLDLSLNIPPTPKEKQRLIRTVWLNYEMPPAVLGNQPKYAIPSVKDRKLTFKVVSEKPEGYAAPGYLLPTARGDYFSIAPDKFGYYSSKIDWWEEDYPSFLEENDHLRSFVDGYLEGKFKTKDRAWLDRALQCFTTRLVQDFGDIASPLLQMDAPFPTINGKKMSEVVNEIDITYVKAKLCPDFQQMTANAIILIPAYIEFTQLLEEKPKLRRCAYKDCNNIFHVTHQSRKYCFDKVCLAKRSAESSKESDNRSRNIIRKRIARALDEWLEDEAQIYAIDLMDKKISSIANILKNPEDSVKSLGTYLSGKLMKELLREKGIELTIKEEGNNLYCFERIAIP